MKTQNLPAFVIVATNHGFYAMRPNGQKTAEWRSQSGAMFAGENGWFASYREPSQTGQGRPIPCRGGASF